MSIKRRHFILEIFSRFLYNRGVNKKQLSESLIERFLAPFVEIGDPVKRRKIKLLSALLLFFIVGSFLYGGVQWYLSANYANLAYNITVTNVIMGLAYFLNRKGRIIPAAWFASLALSCSIAVSSFLAPAGYNDRYLFVMLMPVILGSMVLPIRGTLLLAGFNFLGILSIIFLAPGIHPTVINTAIGFFITMTTLVVLFIYHRNRVEAERQSEILEKEEKYRLLVENINDAIFMMDPNGDFTYVSPAVERMSGHKVEELQGFHYLQFVAPESREEMQTFIEELKKHKEKLFEFQVLTKDQRNLHLRISSHVVEKNGEFIGIAGVATNITETRRLEDQLHQAQKMESVGRLAGGISHDFNNLLTVIKGYCEMLLNDEKLPEGPVGLVQGIKTASDRAAALTQQLLAFSRKQLVEPEVLNLNSQVTVFHGMLERIIGENIILETRLAPDIGNIKVDPSQLEQVIMNLTVNAADAMEQGGQLTIETANVYLDEDYCSEYNDLEPGDFVMLSVSDTGCGFDESVGESIFEPFFTTKTSGKGTGLGLSTVYGIVKQHGGHIWFHSAPGNGTAFKIYFPEVDAPLPDTSPDPQESTRAIKTVDIKGGETLMVVEDEMGLREVIVQSLKEYGYNVFAAENGQEALEICNQTDNLRIDLLVTDVVMPGMNGKELADQMSEMFPGLKVLFISGYAKKTILNQGIPLEDVSLLAKPFSPKALVKKIRYILGN